MNADALKPNTDELHSVSQYNCPICGSCTQMLIAEIDQMPVLCHVLFDRYEDAMDVVRGEIRLMFCQECGHIFNAAFEPKKITYNPFYENSLHYSGHFQKYAESTARELVERHNLRRKFIIEIGCGQGDFLKLLCDIGDNLGLGFDPAHRMAATTPNVIERRIQFINDYYSESYAHLQADFICSRHMLEHTHAPVELMQMIRSSPAEQEETIVVFEVPNALYTIRDLGIWDIIYEHYSYFSPYSLERLFYQTGFVNCTVRESYAGQFLIIEAVMQGPKSGLPDHYSALPNEFMDNVAAFAQNYQWKLQDVCRTMETLRQSKRKAVVWGAGSKGITFLNMLRAYGLGDLVEFIIDINPRKHKRFISGSGQQIMAPGFLTAYKPDVIIIMNSIYIEEIRRLLDDIGVQADIMLV